MRCVVKSTSVPRFCNKFSSNEVFFFIFTAITYSGSGDIKNIAETYKTWMGKLLVSSDGKSCCWKSAIRRIDLVRIHQSSYLEANLFAFDGARGRRQYGHFIPRTKLFRSLAGRRNESSNQISGYIRHICCMELR